MKLKAVLREGCLPAIKAAVESEPFELLVVNRVLVPHLHMSQDVGPAEFYIQESDVAVGRRRNLCEVRLSGVSVSKRRATDDFYKARHALERLYQETIFPFLAKDEQLQLMVCLMLDQAPYLEKTSLIERSGKPAIWITGGGTLPPPDFEFKG